MKLKLLAVLFACFNPTALWAAQQTNADISDPQELVDIVNSRLDSMRADHSPVVTKLPELDRQKLQEVINQNQDIAKSEALLKGQALMNTGSRVFTDLKNNEDMNSLVKEGQALEEKYGDPQRSNSMLNHYDILIFISFYDVYSFIYTSIKLICNTLFIAIRVISILITHFNFSI